MNANPKFLAATAHVDDAAVRPLPNSRKVYVGDLKVPMREVTQSDTPSMFGGEKNPPVYVYDCSGPYTDPAAKIDIRASRGEPTHEITTLDGGDRPPAGGRTGPRARGRVDRVPVRGFAGSSGRFRHRRFRPARH